MFMFSACHIVLRCITEAVLCVSSWVVIKEVFGALIPRKTLRCWEFCLWHHRQATWGSAHILAIHPHSFLRIIAAGVDCEVSAREAATGEQSRQHQWSSSGVQNCRVLCSVLDIDSYIDSWSLTLGCHRHYKMCNTSWDIYSLWGTGREESWFTQVTFDWACNWMDLSTGSSLCMCLHKPIGLPFSIGRFVPLWFDVYKGAAYSFWWGCGWGGITCSKQLVEFIWRKWHWIWDVEYIWPVCVWSMMV